MRSISYESMNKMMHIDKKIMGIDKDLKEIWCFLSEHLCRKLGNPTSKGGPKKGRGRQRGDKGRGKGGRDHTGKRRAYFFKHFSVCLHKCVISMSNNRVWNYTKVAEIVNDSDDMILKADRDKFINRRRRSITTHVHHPTCNLVYVQRKLIFSKSAYDFHRPNTQNEGAYPSTKFQNTCI